MTNLSSP